jgi:hypothetical protein
MKQNKQLPDKLRAYVLPCSLFIAGLLLFISAGAQQPKAKNAKNASTAVVKNVTTSLNTPPVALSMKEFAKTPQGAKRRQQFGKNFGVNGRDSMKIKYPDGTSLTLRMVKNPRFGNQPTNITAKIKRDKNKKPEHSTDSKGQQWTCTTDHVQLTATSTTFLNNDYSNSASHIYPGACYTFEDFYNGSYKEQTGDRNPITIVTDNPNIKGSSYVTIKDPNMGTVLDAVHKLFREATGKAATESLTYQIYQTTNDADQSMKISGGASGYGASVSASYSKGSQSNTMNFTIDAIKTLFSITTTPPEGGFFKDPKVEATPNLMVIGSVTYGIRVLANMTVTLTSQQEAIALGAAYSGFGVSANVNFKEFSSNKSVNSSINCYVVGGPGNSTITFDKKDLEKQIEKVISGATYQNAKPVKYEFYDMAGNVIGSNSATDHFAVRQCTPGTSDPRLESVFVSFLIGGDGKNNDTNYELDLYPGNVNLDKTTIMRPPVFLYNEFADGGGQVEYKPNEQITVKLLEVNKTTTLSEFTKNGGAIVLNEFPPGNDKWQNAQLNLTLNFEGGVSHQISFTNANVSEVDKRLILYFTDAFKVQ